MHDRHLYMISDADKIGGQLKPLLMNIQEDATGDDYRVDVHHYNPIKQREDEQEHKPHDIYCGARMVVEFQQYIVAE